MADFDEQIRCNLEEDWGPAAHHSEYKRGDLLRYRADGSTWSGVIVWITGPSESRVEGRDSLPMRYIVERHGWTGFPDVVYSKDVLSGEPQEPELERCKYCLGLHSKGTSEYCPRNPNKQP